MALEGCCKSVRVSILTQAGFRPGVTGQVARARANSSGAKKERKRKGFSPKMEDEIEKNSSKMQEHPEN